MSKELAPERISELFNEFPLARRILVAFSGGLDSRVLLHLVAQSRALHSRSVCAVHVDHGLQEMSSHWAEQCQEFCNQEKIELCILQALLQPGKGQSIEAIARERRYALIERVMQKNDMLLLAQHADDQVETFLLQLLRGAGPSGLASMPKKRDWGESIVIRPLLDFSRKELHNYAIQQELSWIDDPSNQDLRFARNFLRHEVLPVLEKRFPSYRKTIARSAKHCGEAVNLLQELCEGELAQVMAENKNQLFLGKLRRLSNSKQDNLIRNWIKINGFYAPRTNQLAQIKHTLIASESAPEAVVMTRDYELRVYRGKLYLLNIMVPVQPFIYKWQVAGEDLSIESLEQTISRRWLLESGIRVSEDALLIIKSREGGEKIRQGFPPRHRLLKKIFQEKSIPPWQRQNYFLIYHREKVIAIPGLAVDPDYAA